MKKVRSMVSLRRDPVQLHMDAWAVKKLFSLALRRAGGDKRGLSEAPVRKVP